MKKTYIPAPQLFRFSQHNWPGWKLGTVITGFYSHHDGTHHYFEGVATVDQIRRTTDGRIEVIVRDYPDEKTAAKPPVHDTLLQPPGIRITSNLHGAKISSARFLSGRKLHPPRTSPGSGMFPRRNGGSRGNNRR